MSFCRVSIEITLCFLHYVPNSFERIHRIIKNSFQALHPILWLILMAYDNEYNTPMYSAKICIIGIAFSLNRVKIKLRALQSARVQHWENKNSFPISSIRASSDFLLIFFIVLIVRLFTTTWNICRWFHLCEPCAILCDLRGKNIDQLGIQRKHKYLVARWHKIHLSAKCYWTIIVHNKVSNRP